MLGRYARIPETCQPYFVLSGLHQELVEMVPFGVAVPPQNVFDPLDLGSADFLTLVQRLDDLVFVPIGMEMPRWVFYDCAEMPGGIFGFGRPADQLDGWLRNTLRVPADYHGLVPLSAIIMIPMLEPGTGLNYSLVSVNQTCAGGGPAGLKLFTAVLGLAAFRFAQVVATAQWRSSSLKVHARFAPLDLLTAWTPAHTLPATATFRTRISLERLAAAIGSEPVTGEPTMWLDADDRPTMRALQGELEEGAEIQIVGPPVIDGAIVRVPLVRR